MKHRNEVVATALVGGAVVIGSAALLVAVGGLTGWQLLLLSLVVVAILLWAAAALRHAFSARAPREVTEDYQGNLAEEWSGSSRLPDHEGRWLRHA